MLKLDLSLVRKEQLSQGYSALTLRLICQNVYKVRDRVIELQSFREALKNKFYGLAGILHIVNCCLTLKL